MNTNREIPAPPRHPEITTQVLVADDLLDQAFDWLCHRRKDWPPEADVWRFRRDWSAEKARIQEELLAGNGLGHMKSDTCGKKILPTFLILITN